MTDIYDSWGNTLSVQDVSGQEITSAELIANLNPFRYRGYYFDSETGLYYLQNRYYDPQTCRFVNGDVFICTGQGFTGNNMFAYCLNNPVNRTDPLGKLAATATVAGSAIGFVLWELGKTLLGLLAGYLIADTLIWSQKLTEIVVEWDGGV